jgi:hypothetical protein
VKIFWQMLQVYANTITWDEMVALICFAYNTSRNKSTEETPFFITHGYDPVLPIDSEFCMKMGQVEFEALTPWVRHQLTSLRSAWEAAGAALDAAKARQKVEFDQHRTGSPQIAIGDLVLLKNHVLSAKSEFPLKYGPEPVRVLGVAPERDAITVNIPKGSRRRDKVNIADVLLYRRRPIGDLDFEGEQLPPGFHAV